MMDVFWAGLEGVETVIGWVDVWEIEVVGGGVVGEVGETGVVEDGVVMGGGGVVVVVIMVVVVIVMIWC